MGIAPTGVGARPGFEAVGVVAERFVLVLRHHKLPGSALDDLGRLILVEDNVPGKHTNKATCQSKCNMTDNHKQSVKISP